MTTRRQVVWFWARGARWSVPQLDLSSKQSSNARCFPSIGVVFYVFAVHIVHNLDEARWHGALGSAKSVFGLGDAF